MGLSTMEIMRMANEFKAQKSIKKPAQDRIRVIAGSRKIGELVNGQAITGFGKTWSQFVPDDEACVYGLQPGQNHHVTLQYAYFN